MGKLFESEIRLLGKTYQWARSVPIDPICSFIDASRSFPLLSVGSGGSMTVAQMASLLHQASGITSKAVTPLEFVYLGKSIIDSNVFLFSGNGNNKDILSTFRFAADAEPRQVITMCMRKHSPLSIIAAKYEYTRFVDYDLPTGRDGFLATNSLLASAVILVRAYNSIFSFGDRLPVFLPAVNELEECTDEGMEALLERDNLVVLNGYWGQPAATDIESKFTEAALGQVQIADYRNFGHGRHHWLAKYGEKTGVIALQTPEDSGIAQKTLDCLPDNIPSTRITTEFRGPAGSIDLLVKVMKIVNLAGKARGINPAKPGVPTFGRRIYHIPLPAQSRFSGKNPRIRRVQAAAILRKSKALTFQDLDDLELKYWQDAYRDFSKNMQHTYFGGVVIDYDGTICNIDERYIGPSLNVISELVRLLKGGFIIGIATGRGKSVKYDLRKLIPESYWERVLVGYYSGSDIASLTDDQSPNTSTPFDPTLERLYILMKDHFQLSSIANIQCRPNQMTVEYNKLSFSLKTKTIVQDIINTAQIREVRIFESTHSVDILAPGVSKLNVVTFCQQVLKSLGRSEYILCIGDKGEWPGNDHELLTSPLSLSVDTVSTSSTTCWNVAQPGHRGTQATTEYLKAIELKGGLGRFQMVNNL